MITEYINYCIPQCRREQDAKSWMGYSNGSPYPINVTWSKEIATHDYNGTNTPATPHLKVSFSSLLFLSVWVPYITESLINLSCCPYLPHPNLSQPNQGVRGQIPELLVPQWVTNIRNVIIKYFQVGKHMSQILIMRCSKKASSE